MLIASFNNFLKVIDMNQSKKRVVIGNIKMCNEASIHYSPRKINPRVDVVDLIRSV